MIADDQKTTGATGPTNDATSSIKAETESRNAPASEQTESQAVESATEQVAEPTTGAAAEQTTEPAAASAATTAVAAAEKDAKPTDGEGEGSKQAPQEKKKPRVHPRDAVKQLAAAWPEAFSTDPKAVKPLAIGILQQILADRPAELDGLNSKAIRTAMKFYTSRLPYHFAMKNAEQRIDLKGEPAEPVDDKARSHAEEQIKAIHAQRDARRAEQGDTKEDGKKKPRRPRKAGGKPVGERKGTKRRGDRRPNKGTDQRQASKENQPDPALKHMSMEEKLDRLAQRFGQDGAK